MHNFKDLSVWQKSRKLTSDVYLLTKKFPDGEKYSIISQINRSCISIASNIAEGAGRFSTKGFIQFLHVAYGSAFELETQMILSCDLGYITQEELNIVSEHIQEVEKMLYGLIQHYRVVSSKS